MTLDDFIIVTSLYGKVESTFDHCFRPQIVCADGFKMSVQGSLGHYCNPRKTSTYYDSMEIGYPSAIEPELLDYAEDSDRPTDTVYGYVPIAIIRTVILKHGGINTKDTFKTK